MNTLVIRASVSQSQLSFLVIDEKSLTLSSTPMYDSLFSLTSITLSKQETDLDKARRRTPETEEARHDRVKIEHRQRRQGSDWGRAASRYRQ
ncbi:hypothetical protein HN51_004504 [Arachis hypogaea]